MKAGVLYSGGKDSSLAAMMLGTYYEVELNTFVFDPLRQIPSLEAAAKALGFPLRKRVFREGLLNEMVDLVKACGYPNDAINAVHRIAVESLSGEYAVVGDGTRFNDRVPMLTRAEVQSLGNRTGCSVRATPARLCQARSRPSGGPVSCREIRGDRDHPERRLRIRDQGGCPCPRAGYRRPVPGTS